MRKQLDFRARRGFIGGGYSGEFFDLIGARPYVEPFRIPGFANFERGIDEYLDKSPLRHDLPNEFTMRAVGRDESGDTNQSRISKQPGHLADPADVLLAIGRGKSQIRAEPVAHVVAIEQVSMFAEVEQLPFEFGCDCGFTGGGKAGQPKDATTMAVPQFPLRHGNFAMTPIDIVAFLKGVRRTARVIVSHDNAASGNLQSINNNESAGRDNFGMGVKGNRAAGMQGEFSHFVTG